jgi:hypothetical protein
MDLFDLGDGLGVVVTPSQPRLANSKTAQISNRADVSPGTD